jgi:hypothetical protein
MSVSSQMMQAGVPSLVNGACECVHAEGLDKGSDLLHLSVSARQEDLLDFVWSRVRA